MLADQIVRSGRAGLDLPGGAGVREFADREFPREDLHWVAASVRPRIPRPGSRRSVWARFVGYLRSPGQDEAGDDRAAEPAPA